MENCSLALHIPEYGSEAMEITRVGSKIDVWSLAVDDKVDSHTLSYRTLPRRIDKVGSFTPRYNATEQLPSFACESGTYYAFLLACPQGARKDDCWVDVTSTKQKSIGACSFRPKVYAASRLFYQDSTWCRSRRSESARRLFLREPELQPKLGTTVYVKTNRG